MAKNKGVSVGNGQYISRISLCRGKIDFLNNKNFHKLVKKKFKFQISFPLSDILWTKTQLLYEKKYFFPTAVPVMLCSRLETFAKKPLFHQGNKWPQIPHLQVQIGKKMSKGP